MKYKDTMKDSILQLVVKKTRKNNLIKQKQKPKGMEKGFIVNLPYSD